MSSTFFTTDDGDIILRAGPEADSKHDFRVHKVILSLASPVFKDMFTFPQPPDQTSNEHHQLPIVDVLDPPKDLDMILRFVYPGIEPPNIVEPQTLTTLLSMADKYNIASIYPALRGVLKTFLPRCPFLAYIIACRFGFLEEAKGAAKASRMASFLYTDYREDLQHIPSTDLFRLVQFLHQREHYGRAKIHDALGPVPLDEFVECQHGDDAKEYYFRLEKAVEEAFVENPCVESKDLFTVLDKIPDPPPGCKPPPKAAEWYYEGGDENAFNCPLQPMTIRRRLADVAEELDEHNDVMLDKFFGKGVGSG